MSQDKRTPQDFRGYVSLENGLMIMVQGREILLSFQGIHDAQGKDVTEPIHGEIQLVFFRDAEDQALGKDLLALQGRVSISAEGVLEFMFTDTALVPITATRMLVMFRTEDQTIHTMAEINIQVITEEQYLRGEPYMH